MPVEITFPFKPINLIFANFVYWSIQIFLYMIYVLVELFNQLSDIDFYGSPKQRPQILVQIREILV
jgi:hypothetical protein